APPALVAPPRVPPQKRPPLPPRAHRAIIVPPHPPSCPARDTRQARSPIAASAPRAPSQEFPLPLASQLIPAAVRRLPPSPLPRPPLSQIASHSVPILRCHCDSSRTACPPQPAPAAFLAAPPACGAAFPR